MGATRVQWTPAHEAISASFWQANFFAPLDMVYVGKFSLPGIISRRCGLFVPTLISMWSVHGEGRRIPEAGNGGGRLAGSAHDFRRMAAGITHPPPIPSPHDEFSQSAEQSRPFSQETFFHAFGAAPVQPAIIRFKFSRG